MSAHPTDKVDKDEKIESMGKGVGTNPLGRDYYGQKGETDWDTQDKMPPAEKSNS